MSRRAFSPTAPALVILLSALLWGFSPLSAHAQKAGPWWTPVSVEVGDRERGWYEEYDAPRRSRGPKAHVPKGHLPPPGACRIWVRGRPPGHQPPPMACAKALRYHGPSDVVVTHDGSIYGRKARRPLPPRWERRPASDVVFRRAPRPESRVIISIDILIDLLGERGYGRLRDQQRRAGVSGAIAGRWVRTDRSGSTVLQVRAGRYPLAELVDTDRDGRVDAWFVYDSR